MFVAVTNNDRAACDRVEQWATSAWPDVKTQTAHGWRIWTDGRERQQAIVNERDAAVVDGLIWREDLHWDRNLSVELAQEVSTRWPLDPRWDGSFSLAILKERFATLAVDPAGLRRAYWCRDGSGTLTVSSLQLPCALASNAEPDLIGVAEILSLGHLLGNRTIFAKVHEVWPGQCIDLGVGSEPVRRTLDHVVAATGRSIPIGVAEAAEEIAPILQSSSRRASRAFSRPGLALSSGTDSRLLLSSLLPDAAPKMAVSYGDPAEGDVTIPQRLARSIGIPHHTVNLTGKLLAGEDEARSDALRCEATWHPAWLSVNLALEELGCTLLLLGDLTDSLQVRGQAFWDRRVRVKRQVRRLTHPGAPEELPSHYRMPTLWWDNWRKRMISRVLARSRHLRLDLTDAELSHGLEHDLDTAWEVGELARYQSAVGLEDALQIVTARQQAGSQVNAVGGGAVGHSAFGTRAAVTAARGLGIDVRKDRKLILELTRRILPRPLRLAPTATIPLIPASSPLIAQNAMWGLRFSADWALRRANRIAAGRIPRERVSKSLELPYEYRSKGEDFFLGHDWTESGVFTTDRFQETYLAMRRGTQVPMFPLEQYTAVRVDTLLARNAKL